MNTKKSKKVFVGMSGGVDSSVSAALLQAATPNNFEKLFGRPTPKGFRGYDVTGVFIKVWQAPFLPCNWKEERLDAMRVAAKLGIPFLTFNFEKEYKKEVVDYMIEEYKAGRTPNPDVCCNQHVKFRAFFDKAISMGADFIATGHYAQVKKVGKEFQLLAGDDANKDQSYFLWTLSQKELSRTLFPVGHLEKPEVRRLAEKFGLPTATKKDSQGLCFIGKVELKDFLGHFVKGKKGKVVNEKGEVIGSHDGALFYTLGQRHGFTITEKTPDDEAYFIVKKDVKKNVLVVSNKKDENNFLAYTRIVKIKNLHWTSGIPKSGRIYNARCRYRQPLEAMTIVIKNKNSAVVTFKNNKEAVTPGQSLVIYDGAVCLGGGIIV